MRLANLACKQGQLWALTELQILFLWVGEPLANYKNVIHAVRCLVDTPPSGFGMSARNITAHSWDWFRYK